MPNCQCEIREIRKRVCGNGLHYVYQCMECGRQKGGALKKEIALKALKGLEPEAFDESLSKKFLKPNRVELAGEEQVRNEFVNAFYSCSKFYNSILMSGMMVRELKNFFGQEQSLAFIANQAPKLRKMIELKEDVEPENLPESGAFENELQLKKWLEENLSCDFEIYPEVDGIHSSTQELVRIDYLLHPKQHLIDKGFNPGHFGVEVKFLPRREGVHHNGQAFWQTITYQESVFDLSGCEIHPFFSVILSNFSFEYERERFSIILKNEWASYANLAGRSRVGSFEIRKRGDLGFNWAIRFSGQLYFASKWVPGPKKEYKKGVHADNFLNKIRIGNAQTRRGSNVR